MEVAEPLRRSYGGGRSIEDKFHRSLCFEGLKCSRHARSGLGC